MKKKLICTTSSSDLTRYNPPPIGNGVISAGIDCEGIQVQRDYPGISRPEFVLEGIRYNSSCPGLISFGHLGQALPGAGALVSWTQSLDTSRGLVECECIYESGVVARTSVFCHLNRNVVAIRKEFSEPVDYSFVYQFGEPRHVKSWNEPGETAIYYSAQEQEDYTGKIQVFCSQNLNASVTPMALSFTGKTVRADFFIVFQSSIFSPEDTRNLNFDALLAESESAWNAYWEESFIDVPEENIMKMYNAAQYNLKLASTPWSIPTGIFNSHWGGRFFGFDEHYAAMALLSSGHLGEPRRVCQFRSDTLHWALERMECCGIQSGAKFPWETLENGCEGTLFGAWMDHIFHMGAIALTVYRYYIIQKTLIF